MSSKKSNNPLLAEIQDLIEEKFDFESWPSGEEWAEGGVVKWIAKQGSRGIIGDWIDVHVFGEESYVFTIGIVDDKLVIYRPGRDAWSYSNQISLYNEGFLEELWDQIEDVISNITK
jgi:hypothetical protein